MAQRSRQKSHNKNDQYVNHFLLDSIERVLDSSSRANIFTKVHPNITKYIVRDFDFRAEQQTAAVA